MLVVLLTIGFIILFGLMYVVEWRKTTENIQAVWTKDERGHYICGAKIFKPKKEKK
jgi:hypothetical protein